MKDNERNFLLDDENEDNDLTEYLERDLNEDDENIREHSRSIKYQKRYGETARDDEGKKANKVLEFYRNNTMKVLWSSLAVLAVLLIAALIATNVAKKDDSENENKSMSDNVPVSDEESKGESTEDESGNGSSFVAEPSDSVYNQVIEKFLKNSYVEWNEEELSKVCDSIQNMSKDRYVLMNKYIETVSDVHCYVGYVNDDGKELIYATYNLKFANIETTVPQMEAYLMVKTEDVYRIHNFELQDELDFYTNAVSSNQNYKDLVSGINKQLDIALESDSDLKKVYDTLNNIGQQE